MSSKARIFLSYSRRDRVQMLAVVEGLERRGFDPQIDTDDIAPGEDWRSRLGDLISSADTIVFLLSPNSARSEVCAWEVGEAQRLSKRIFPFVIQPLGETAPAAELSARNWIDASNKPLADAINLLADAIDTNLPWVREHTRLAELALLWRENRERTAYLLRGDRLSSAEIWLNSQPEAANHPTELHRTFIVASQQAATQRLRYGLIGALSVAAVAGGLAILAEFNRREAVVERERAERNYTVARKTVDDLVFNITGGLANQEGLSGSTIEKILSATQTSVDQLEAQNPGDPKLFRTQTVMLSQSANIYARSKMPESAKASYELAIKRARVFVHADPANPTWKTDLAALLNNYAIFAGDQGDLPLKTRLQAEAHDLRLAAHAARPTSDTAASLALSYRTLAMDDMREGRKDAAREKIAAATALHPQTEGTSTENTAERADTLEAQSQIEMREGRRQEAAQTLDELVRLRRALLAKDADHLVRKSDLARALVFLGDAQEADAAERTKAFYSEANDLLMAAYYRERDNVQFANQYFASLTRLARWERRQKNQLMAMAHLDDAEDVLKFLMGINPNDVGYLSHQTVLQTELGTLSTELGDHEEALMAYGRGIDAARKLKALQPEVTARASELAHLLELALGVHLAMQAPEKARVLNEESAAIYDELLRRQPDNPDFLTFRAFSHLHSAMIATAPAARRKALGDALEIARRLERSGQLKPEHAELTAVLAGELAKIDR